MAAKPNPNVPVMGYTTVNGDRHVVLRFPDTPRDDIRSRLRLVGITYDYHNYWNAGPATRRAVLVARTLADRELPPEQDARDFTGAEAMREAASPVNREAVTWTAEKGAEEDYETITVDSAKGVPFTLRGGYYVRFQHVTGIDNAGDLDGPEIALGNHLLPEGSVVLRSDNQNDCHELYAVTLNAVGGLLRLVSGSWREPGQSERFAEVANRVLSGTLNLADADEVATACRGAADGGYGGEESAAESLAKYGWLPPFGSKGGDKDDSGARAPKYSAASEVELPSWEDAYRHVGQEIADAVGKLETSELAGFYPTPPKVIDRVMQLASIDNGVEYKHILEPSAGKGDFADALRARARYETLDLCEIEEPLRDILHLKCYSIVGDDFTEHQNYYDLIVMNPPFELGRDIEHMRHAYANLSMAGKVIAVMQDRPLTDGYEKEFQKWLSETRREGATVSIEKLPAGAFRDAFRSTNVATRIVTIERPPFALKEDIYPDGTVNDRKYKPTKLYIPLDRDPRIRLLRKRYDLSPDESRRFEEVIGDISEQTRTLVMRGRNAGIPQVVLDEQLQDIAMGLSAFQRKKTLFLIGNEAGTGKTFCLGGFMREVRRVSDRPIYYVTTGQELIGQARKNLKDFLAGVKNVHFTTYSTIRPDRADEDEAEEQPGQRKEPTVKGMAGGIVIFDEAHNIKNVESLQGKEGQRILEHAVFTVLASATPFENPVEAEYLEASRVFDSEGGFKLFAAMYGASVSRKKYEHIQNKGEKMTLEWPSRNAVQAEAKRLQQHARDFRAWVVREGLLTQRKKRILPELVEARFRPVRVDPAWGPLFTATAAAYVAARNHFTGGGKALRQRMAVSMHAANTFKRMLEATKVAAVIASARDHLAAGRQIVLFTETKAERHLGKFRLSGAYTAAAKRVAKAAGRKTKDAAADSDDTDEDSILDAEMFGGSGRTYHSWPEMQRISAEYEARSQLSDENGKVILPFAEILLAIAQEMHNGGVDQMLPSVPEALAAAFDPKLIAYYTGAFTVKQNEAAKEAWMSGNKRILIATMAKGGTGLSLHDEAGDKPRAQIGANLPWTAKLLEQTLGRTIRYGMKSKAIVEWLIAPGVAFERKYAIRLARRLGDLGATVKGVDYGAADSLEDSFDLDQAAAKDLAMFGFDAEQNERAASGKSITMGNVAVGAELTGEAAELAREENRLPAVSAPVAAVAAPRLVRVPGQSADEDVAETPEVPARPGAIKRTASTSRTATTPRARRIRSVSPITNAAPAENQSAELGTPRLRSTTPKSDTTSVAAKAATAGWITLPEVAFGRTETLMQVPVRAIAPGQVFAGYRSDEAGDLFIVDMEAAQGTVGINLNGARSKKRVSRVEGLAGRWELVRHKMDFALVKAGD